MATPANPRLNSSTPTLVLNVHPDHVNRDDETFSQEATTSIRIEGSNLQEWLKNLSAFANGTHARDAVHIPAVFHTSRPQRPHFQTPIILSASRNLDSCALPSAATVGSVEEVLDAAILRSETGSVISAAHLEAQATSQDVAHSRSGMLAPAAPPFGSDAAADQKSDMAESNHFARRPVRRSTAQQPVEFQSNSENSVILTSMRGIKAWLHPDRVPNFVKRVWVSVNDGDWYPTLMLIDTGSGENVIPYSLVVAFKKEEEMDQSTETEIISSSMHKIRTLGTINLRWKAGRFWFAHEDSFFVVKDGDGFGDMLVLGARSIVKHRIIRFRLLAGRFTYGPPSQKCKSRGSSMIRSFDRANSPFSFSTASVVAQEKRTAHANECAQNERDKALFREAKKETGVQSPLQRRAGGHSIHTVVGDSHGNNRAS